MKRAVPFLRRALLSTLAFVSLVSGGEAVAACTSNCLYRIYVAGIQGASAPAPSATHLSASPTALAFGNVTAGQTLSQAFTLSNTGNVAASSLAFSLPGTVTQTNTCGGTLAAGSSCTVTATYAPITAATLSGNITVADQDSSAQVAVSGTGVAATDPYFSNVTLLLHMAGTNGSTAVTDQIGHAVTVTGATISTAQSKFGGSSLYLGGAGYLSVSATALGSGDFTIEWWMNPSNTGLVEMFDSRTSGTGGDGIDFASTGYTTTANLVGINSGVSLTANTWTFIALVRHSGTLSLYQDGVLKASTTNLTGNYTGGNYRIGGNPYGNIGYFTGYMQEVRITPGVARYTQPFTPPTIAFPNQ